MALDAECLGAKGQANNHADRKRKCKLCCRAGISLTKHFHLPQVPAFTPSLVQLKRLKVTHQM